MYGEASGGGEDAPEPQRIVEHEHGRQQDDAGHAGRSARDGQRNGATHR